MIPFVERFSFEQEGLGQREKLDDTKYFTNVFQDHSGGLPGVGISWAQGGRHV